VGFWARVSLTYLTRTCALLAACIALCHNRFGVAITKGCGVLVPAARAAALTVSIHESDELDQTFLGSIRPDAQRGSRS
jgi:hypothetical protein